jgi:hypothetical protein
VGLGRSRLRRRRVSINGTAARSDTIASGMKNQPLRSRSERRRRSTDAGDSRTRVNRVNGSATFDRVDYVYDGDGARKSITSTTAAGVAATTSFTYQADSIEAE